MNEKERKHYESLPEELKEAYKKLVESGGKTADHNTVVPDTRVFACNYGRRTTSPGVICKACHDEFEANFPK